jgi:hypothetical protein
VEDDRILDVVAEEFDGIDENEDEEEEDGE